MLAAYQGRFSSSAPMPQASSPGARPRFRSCILACSECLFSGPGPSERPQSQRSNTRIMLQAVGDTLLSAAWLHVAVLSFQKGGKGPPTRACGPTGEQAS